MNHQLCKDVEGYVSSHLMLKTSQMCLCNQHIFHPNLFAFSEKKNLGVVHCFLISTKNMMFESVVALPFKFCQICLSLSQMQVVYG